MSERDEWIARKAYDLWEQAGRPQGLDQEHWQHAAHQWERDAHSATDPLGRSDWDDEDEG